MDAQFDHVVLYTQIPKRDASSAFLFLQPSTKRRDTSRSIRSSRQCANTSTYVFKNLYLRT